VEVLYQKARNNLSGRSVHKKRHHPHASIPSSFAKCFDILTSSLSISYAFTFWCVSQVDCLHPFSQLGSLFGMKANNSFKVFANSHAISLSARPARGLFSVSRPKTWASSRILSSLFGRSNLFDTPAVDCCKSQKMNFRRQSIGVEAFLHFVARYML
jgi:hypothetical protein